MDLGPVCTAAGTPTSHVEIVNGTLDDPSAIPLRNTLRFDGLSILSVYEACVDWNMLDYQD